MVFLAGSAWLPWCVFALYKYSKHFEYRYIVLAGVLFSLNTVAASPAYTIVLFYIFVIWRSEGHTSELQSRPHLVCRLLLEKKNSAVFFRSCSFVFTLSFKTANDVRPYELSPPFSYPNASPNMPSSMIAVIIPVQPCFLSPF